MGTMIQGHRLGEADFRGERFARLAGDLQGQQRPARADPAADHPRRSTRQYLEAGADIIETNTFNSNAPSLRPTTGWRSSSYELNLAAARLAREAADEFDREDAATGRASSPACSGRPARPPRSRPTSTIPGFRNITFDELVAAYTEAVRGLVDGGVDLVLLRDDLRHAQRQGGDLRDRESVRGSAASGCR